MSNQDEIKKDPKDKIEQATESLKGLFANLVPVDMVSVTDIFGVKHDLATSISARKQIKILRIIEEVKDIEFNLNITDETNILEMLLSLASNEKFLTAVGKCFDLAYPHIVNELKEQAINNGYECDDALDLFPIEDVLSAIIPLFIRLAKRTIGAFQNLEMVS